jgi:putative nucleotidyltransferase with HDIG domain
METDRFGGLQAWLSANRRGWRLVVGCICAFALALFFHFREVRVEVLELNTPAPGYVVAQIDFEFPDYETTVVLKQQAMQDVGPIYQIDDVQVRDARYRLEEKLIRDKQWRTLAPMSTFEEMYKAADTVETLLLEARFTDARTIQKVRELHLPGQAFYEFIPDISQDSVLPSEFWAKIGTQVARSGPFHPQTIQFVMQGFQHQSWTLEQDEGLMQSIRTQVSRTVPERMTRVVAGTRIIDQGDLVTSRHLTMLQAMKQALSDSRHISDPLTILASCLLSAIFVAISALYFRISQPSFIRSLRQISLFVCIVVLTLCFAKLFEFILLKSGASVVQGIRYPILAPFATILVCILLSPRTALFAATFLSIILAVSLAVDHSRFLVLNLVTSMVVIICAKGLRKRKQVFTVCIQSWLAAIPVLYAFTLSEGEFWSKALVLDLSASLVFMVATAVLVVGLLPALETLFGVLTDMTLMEYMDPSNELLRKMAMDVPGTYQHSLVLGNLAEACAQAIGANGLFCRAATLYHDIGKTMNPQFYTENQEGALSVHQILTPAESAQGIIAHVTDGEALGRKHHLPEPFLDIIREHHGTTLVYYFYRKELDLKGGNPALVDEKAFRYPGPRPRSKESAIIMICDTVEAASRSLEDSSEKGVSHLVDRLVAERAEEGQFDECRLTFEELGKVKRALVKSLLVAHHIRVKYPQKHRKSD